jgi:N-acetylglucosamine-6-phosphate deacetylase
MIVLSSADVVLPDGIMSPATVVIDGDRIVEVVSGSRPGRPGPEHIDLNGYFIVPGFVDVHVHGVDGRDTMESRDAIAAIAARLPAYGVTSFCPTTVACAVVALREVLGGIRDARERPGVGAARVLGAHLESNFISREYRGAQPERCLLLPSAPDSREILDEIDRAGRDVGIVTLAPELDGAFDLIRHLVGRGTRVSLGHSGASFEQAEVAIDAGACHATHLFNRMPPLNHREPGLAGAVLTRKEVAAEIICDGVHLHSRMIQLAIAAKGADRIMAITDGTAAAGLPDGSFASLGHRRICVRNRAAYLDDGTLAGSVTTMDRVFAFLVNHVRLSLSGAAQLCSTNPARQLGLHDRGVVARDALADFVLLDRHLAVKQTYVGGRPVFTAP